MIDAELADLLWLKKLLLQTKPQLIANNTWHMLVLFKSPCGHMNTLWRTKTLAVSGLALNFLPRADGSNPVIWKGLDTSRHGTGTRYDLYTHPLPVNTLKGSWKRCVK